MGVKQWVLRALRGTEWSWNLWQLMDRFSVPGSHMKHCELHIEHTERERQLIPTGAKKRERETKIIFVFISFSIFATECLCPYVSHHLSPPRSVSPSLPLCPFFFLSARGAVGKVNVTPVPMLLKGN